MCSDRLKFCELQMERGRMNSRLKERSLAHLHTHMQVLVRWQQWVDGFFSTLNIQQMTIPLFLSVVFFAPFFLHPFIDERLPLFLPIGLQSSELNIDFIQSLVAASVTTRCLFGNHVHVSSQRNAEREEDEGMKMRDNAENPKRREGDIETQEGRQTGRRERRRTQGDKKTEQGIQQAAIKTGEKRKGRKTQRWMRGDSRRIERGKSFFF